MSSTFKNPKGNGWAKCNATQTEITNFSKPKSSTSSPSSSPSVPKAKPTPPPPSSSSSQTPPPVAPRRGPPLKADTPPSPSSSSPSSSSPSSPPVNSGSFFINFISFFLPLFRNEIPILNHKMALIIINVNTKKSFQSLLRLGMQEEIIITIIIITQTLKWLIKQFSNLV